MAQRCRGRRNSEHSLTHHQAVQFTTVQCVGKAKKKKVFSFLVTNFVAGTPVTEDKLRRERHKDIFTINFM